MGNDKTVKLSPSVEARIRKIEGLPLDEVRSELSLSMAEVLQNQITAKEANAISSAAGKRIKAIEADLKAGKINPG